MDTGQLFMQASARSKVNFLVPVSTSISSKPTMKKFDGVLKEVAPQRHNKNEQPARAETKRPMLKSVERAGEPDQQQQPNEIKTKSRNHKIVSDYDKTTDVENEKKSALSEKRNLEMFSQNVETGAADKPELKLLEESNVITIPQDVDTAVAVAAATLAQPLSEGRMPQSIVTEDNTNKTDGLVRVQNAIPELQLPEGKALQAVTAKAEPGISSEVSGTQNATNGALSPSVEVGAEILTDKSQFQFESLTRNTDSNVELMQQPLSLKAGLTSQEIQTTESMGEQLPLIPVMAMKQNLVVEGQIAVAKKDSDSKTVDEVSQQSANSAAAKLKAVTFPESVKVLPADVSVEAADKNWNEVLLQTPVRSQASASSAEFKFSRSASVEASLGMVNVVVEQPTERLSASVPDSAKVSTGNSVIETVSAEFNGSGSGFMGKDAEGFSQQNLDLPRPGLQQMTNGQVVSSANISTVNVEQAAPQQAKLASSEYVAGQVKTQLSSREIKQGTEQITIMLSPDHLGDIKVNFKLEDQRLRVEIVAENRSARESLLLHADSLKESLARQNINMEKFEVTGGNNGSASQGGNAQPEWREMARNRQSQQWLSSGGYRTQSAELNPSVPVYFARAEKSTLDLHF